MTADRTHYHGDGCTPPHPAATLAEALREWDRTMAGIVAAVANEDFDSGYWQTLTAEVLRLLASGECDELNAAVADAVVANPGRYGLEWIATTDVNSPEPELHYRFARREQADQEGRDDGD